MKSYCVKEKRETLCEPGSERIITIKNGRRMSSCVCSSCGITKTRFIKGVAGVAIGKGIADFSCGYDLKGKRPGTAEECFKKGQIRRYGVKALDPGLLDALVADRIYDKQRKKPKQIKVPELPIYEDLSTPMIDSRYEALMKEHDRLNRLKKKSSVSKKNKTKKDNNSKQFFKDLIDKIKPNNSLEVGDYVVIRNSKFF